MYTYKIKLFELVFLFLNYNTVLIETALTTTQFRKPCDYTY